MEGTRPVLSEIQALVAPAAFGTPRRAVVGWDSGRLAMVLAVLEARCGVNISNRDIFLNVAGGLKITEPAADLAVAAAIVSLILVRIGAAAVVEAPLLSRVVGPLRRLAPRSGPRRQQPSPRLNRLGTYPMTTRGTHSEYTPSIASIVWSMIIMIRAWCAVLLRRDRAERLTDEVWRGVRRGVWRGKCPRRWRRRALVERRSMT